MLDLASLTLAAPAAVSAGLVIALASRLRST